MVRYIVAAGASEVVSALVAVIAAVLADVGCIVRVEPEGTLVLVDALELRSEVVELRAGVAVCKGNARGAV